MPVNKTPITILERQISFPSRNGDPHRHSLEDTIQDLFNRVQVSFPDIKLELLLIRQGFQAENHREEMTETVIARVELYLRVGTPPLKQDLDYLRDIFKKLSPQSENPDSFKQMIKKCIETCANEFESKINNNGVNAETITRYSTTRDFLSEQDIQERITNALAIIKPPGISNKDIKKIIDHLFNVKTLKNYGNREIFKELLEDRLSYLEKLSFISEQGVSPDDKFLEDNKYEFKEWILENVIRMLEEQKDIDVISSFVRFELYISEEDYKDLATERGNYLFGEDDYEKKSQIANGLKEDSGFERFLDDLCTLKTNNIEGVKRLFDDAVRSDKNDISGFYTEAKLNVLLLRYSNKHGLRLKSVSVSAVDGEHTIIDKNGEPLSDDSRYTVVHGFLAYNGKPIEHQGIKVIVTDEGDLKLENGQGVMLINGVVRQIDAIAIRTSDGKSVYIEHKQSPLTLRNKENYNGQISSLVTLAKAHGAEAAVMLNTTTEDLSKDRDRSGKISAVKEVLAKVKENCPASKGFPKLAILDKFGFDITDFFKQTSVG